MNRLIRIAVIGFAFCLFPFMAGAQSFGLKAGMNFSSINNGAVKDNIGYQAGLTYQIDFPLWFSIQPELMFHVKGGKVGTGGESDAFGLGYLEIPVNIQWGIDLLLFRPYIEVSPYVAYAVGKFNDIKNMEWDNFNRFDYGIGVGIGVEIWKFQISGRYSWSLGKLADFRDIEGIGDYLDKNVKGAKLRGFELSLAFLF